jgi:hypothetical protein
MKKKVDPLGSVLLKKGILSRDQLTDVLDLQAQPMPFASVCHILGHATEEELIRALAGQHGEPGVILGRSIINLKCLKGIPKELAFQRMILPVYEDDSNIFLAVYDPFTRELFKEIQLITGKSVLPHMALHITLARAIRLCFAAAERGEPYWHGELADPDELTDTTGFLSVVSDVDDLPEQAIATEAEHDSDDFSGEVVPLDLEDIMEVGELGPEGERTVPDAMSTPPPSAAKDIEPKKKERPSRKKVKVLVADSDTAARTALARVLRPGFRLCQDLKESGRYAHVLCILVGGTAAHAANAETIKERYKADAFLPRNIGPGSTLAQIEELRADPANRAETPGDGPPVKLALELYRKNRIGPAVEAARMCVTWDPLSPRFRFVMANMLHGQERLYEAMDAYQATVDLKPDWFPALTRLAYLQYQKGFVTRAISTWKKAVDVCPNPKMGQNIQSFVNRLSKSLEARRR